MSFGQSGELGEDADRAPLRDPGRAEQQLEGPLERGLATDHLLRLLLQLRDPLLEERDVLAQVLCHGGEESCLSLNRVQSVLFGHGHVDQTRDATRQCAQVEQGLRRRLPRRERHPADELQHDLGIVHVGLGALHQRPGEVPHHGGIDDHDLDPCVRLERPGQVQVVDAGRLERHPGRPTAFAEQPHQLPVSLVIVCDLQSTTLPASFQTDLETPGTDIDAHSILLLHAFPPC